MLERTDKDNVTVIFSWEGIFQVDNVPQVRLFAVKNPKETLATIRSVKTTWKAGRKISSSRGAEIELKEGDQVQAEVTHKGGSLLSPVLTP